MNENMSLKDYEKALLQSIGNPDWVGENLKLIATPPDKKDEEVFFNLSPLPEKFAKFYETEEFLDKNNDFSGENEDFLNNNNVNSGVFQAKKTEKVKFQFHSEEVYLRRFMKLCGMDFKVDTESTNINAFIGWKKGSFNLKSAVSEAIKEVLAVGYATLPDISKSQKTNIQIYCAGSGVVSVYNEEENGFSFYLKGRKAEQQILKPQAKRCETLVIPVADVVFSYTAFSVLMAKKRVLMRRIGENYYLIFATTTPPTDDQLADFLTR